MLERQAQGQPLVRAEVDFPDSPTPPLRSWYEALKTSLLHKFNAIARQFEEFNTRLLRVEDRDVVIVTPTTPGTTQTTTVIADHEPEVRTVVLCAGYTPTAEGADIVHIPIPHGPAGEKLTWAVKRVRLRAVVPGTRCVVAIEASSDLGAFTPRTITDLALAANQYQAERSGEFGPVQSGESMRFNILEFGTAQAWSLTVEITNP